MALEFCGYDDYPYNRVEYNGCLVVRPVPGQDAVFQLERQCYIPRSYFKLEVQEDGREYFKLGALRFTDDNTEVFA